MEARGGGVRRENTLPCAESTGFGKTALYALLFIATLIKTERRPAQVLLARLWGCRSTGRINNNYEAFKHSCPQRCWGRPPPPSPRASRTADAPENRGVPATRESSAACRMSRTKMSAQEPASPGERGITTASPTPQGLCD